MPKKKKRADHDGPTQMNLFDAVDAIQKQVKAVEAPPTEGTANVRDQLRIALSYALKKCPLSRPQVAGEMSHLLGDSEVTKFMLDTWTAESKEGHRIPAEFLPAFCQVTGCREPLRILAEASGWFAMPGQDALRSQMQRLDEEARKIKEKKRELSVLLKTTGSK
ncbi:hypothetical protein Dalk_3580 [Desulfatibacillum aliphaticivorans]|uniref:Uncharacterized protein n=1 Tax=Desulfatibacillum aliphaticivorans TaxID=218208 RepID=B8FGN8_DESAL|nr:hypothetical protein [Desulfatibacillum aliphaticivorans]ACL05268.1 hypothetical protein Dalk_3580 [Desulfatibacillum aliphaticivorans]